MVVEEDLRFTHADRDPAARSRFEGADDAAILKGVDLEIDRDPRRSDEGLRALATLLKKLDEQALASANCQSVFPMH